MKIDLKKRKTDITDKNKFRSRNKMSVITRKKVMTVIKSWNFMIHERNRIV